jgi:threonine synthase
MVQTYCHDCQTPLLAQYDLEALGSRLGPSDIGRRSGGMWRWHELLPLLDPACRVSLGEGGSPLVRLTKVEERLGLPAVFAKIEGTNPTGTFKARGLSAAVSKARELGVSTFVVPTAGNAGAALAAYAARAGIPARVYMPADSKPVYRWEAEAYGAQVTLVNGLIDSAGAEAQAAADADGSMNMATFREPYRVEGKKTMGFELAEAFDFELPHSILYPTGGGTGLVGMWKAFGELKELGWLRNDLPQMISVQAEGCAPIVRAFDSGQDRIQPWTDAVTRAEGLRVPGVFADRLVLSALRESGGTALTVSESDMVDAQRQLAVEEGVLVGLEGAATVAALERLAHEEKTRVSAGAVLFLTGTGLKELG